MTDYRWLWEDEAAEETFRMVRNPRSTTSMLPGEATTETLTVDGVTRTTARPKILEWQFAGRVKSHTEEADLRAFLARGELLLTDHLGDQYRVLVTKCPFIERKVKRGYAADYNANGYVLEGPL